MMDFNCCLLIGGIIRDLKAEQIDLIAVNLSWTPPPPDYQGPAYQVILHIPGGSIKMITEQPYIYMSKDLGVHILQELYPSRDLPGMKREVTVKGIIIRGTFRGAHCKKLMWCN